MKLAIRYSLFAIGISCVVLVVATVAFAKSSHHKSRNAVLTFDGSCEFAGTVTFTPPLTNSAQDVKQVVDAKGTCSGTLVDAARHSHELSDAPVTYQSTAYAKGVSCGSGVNAGEGALGFEFGKLGFHFDETRVTAFPLLRYTGQKGGSAMGTAMPAQDQDPAAALECAGDGMKQFKLQGRLQTTPAISG